MGKQLTLDRCVFCGSCLITCPVTQTTLQESLSPRGKLYFLRLANQLPEDLNLWREFSKSLFSCTACGACEETCTSGVVQTPIFEEKRRAAVESGLFPALSKVRDVIRSSGNVFGLDKDERVDTWLYEVEEHIPSIEERIYEPGKKADIVFFMGCLLTFRSEHLQTLIAALKVLELIEPGYLLLGAEESCCGHPLRLMGFEHEAEEALENVRSIVKNVAAKKVLTTCPGCLKSLRTTLENTSTEAMHISEFLNERIKEVANPLGHRSITYHDPCELFRLNKVTEAPRSLLQKTGAHVSEMPPFCCGGGGLLRVANPELSRAVLRKKLESLEPTAEIITCCPSCKEQLGMERFRVRDIVEIVAESLGIKLEG